jgi:DnaJ-class molecular chaperone
MNREKCQDCRGSGYVNPPAGKVADFNPRAPENRNPKPVQKIECKTCHGSGFTNDASAKS